MPLQRVAAVMAVDTAAVMAVDTVGVTARISAAAATTVVGILAAAISEVGAISSDRNSPLLVGMHPEVGRDLA